MGVRGADISIATPGRPKIWLPADRDKYRESLKRYTKNSVALSEWWAVIETVYAVLDDGGLSSSHLAVLRSAMESKWQQVWGEAGRRLDQLAHYYPAVADVLGDLARHPKASIRLRVVQSVWTDRPPLPVLRDLLANGLQDSSAKVRIFSAERVRQERLLDLLPAIQVAFDSETNAKAKKSMDFSLKLLRDGYFLEESSDGLGYNLVVQGADGAIGGPFVPTADCTPDRIAHLVAAFQDEHGKP